MRSRRSMKEHTMKARMFQLFSVMALFALWIDPIFNGVKW
jgi:hypothetical protein